MTNFTIKDNKYIELLRENIEVKEIDKYGNVFINCCHIYPKKKLYSCYVNYLETVLKKALEISNKNNNNTLICHINLKNIKLKNFSYSFIKYVNERIANNEFFNDKLESANFYYKNTITKGIYNFIYNLIDDNTKKKYNLIYIDD